MHQRRKNYNEEQIVKIFNNKNFKIIINILTTYYKIQDIDQGTNIQKLFSDIITLKETNECDMICEKDFISESTFYRYRQNFYCLIDKMLLTFANKEQYFLSSFYESRKEINDKLT